MSGKVGIICRAFCGRDATACNFPQLASALWINLVLSVLYLSSEEGVLSSSQGKICYLTIFFADPPPELSPVNTIFPQT